MKNISMPLLLTVRADAHSTYALVFRAFLTHNFRQFLFVIHCNVLICEQPGSWTYSLLTYITTGGRCFRSALLTCNVVVRCYSTVHQTVKSYVVLTSHSSLSKSLLYIRI